MAKPKKIVAVLPAYNAAKNLNKFLKAFPFSLFDEVILVDDCSKDQTVKVAEKFKKVQVIRNRRNLGYGGNLKICFGLALKRGAGIVVEIHPDGEYLFNGIEPAFAQIKDGAKLVLGNRFSTTPAGMYFWKIPFTRFLTWIGNLALGTSIPDLHQGFRVYTKELLNQIDYRELSNDYLFSFEIIQQTVFKQLKIASVPVSVNYQGKKRGADFRGSLGYFIGVLWRLSRPSPSATERYKDGGTVCINCGADFLVRRMYQGEKYRVFFCDQCLIGFTWPQPINLKSLYPAEYWNDHSLFGKIKEWLFKLAQNRRIKWINSLFPRGGNILDVGSGEGVFAQNLDSNYHTTSIEPPTSLVRNNSVLKANFITFNSKQKYDAIVFWESLEHVPDPVKYLQKAQSLLKKGGYILIEYPNFNSLERKIFQKSWFHLDIPRHLTHFTSGGLKLIGEQNDLKIINQKNVLALEYTPIGLLISFLRSLGIISDHSRLKPNERLILVLASPLLILTFVIELFFYSFSESPINLVIFQKSHVNPKRH